MKESKISLFDPKKVPEDARQIIQDFDALVQGVQPLNSRQLQQLPQNIRNLSHQMTDDRSNRRLGYMNENIQLSSYVRYFTWWNLVRLTRLFSNLPEQCFPQNDAVCLDAGSGPLTVVTALFLARPELRKLKLTWYCLDVSANSMALGEDIFLSVCAKLGIAGDTWQIIRIKGSFGTSIKQKADFITCANMLNELDQAVDMPPEFKVKKYYEQFRHYAAKDARFILVEPGVPKAARTLALLRDRFLRDGSSITAPCPHFGKCPMDGFGAYTGSKCKWCNFAFETTDAPKNLQKLSVQAKLPKERATLSFIAACGVNDAAPEAQSAAPESRSGVPESRSAAPESRSGVPEALEGPHEHPLSIRITSDKIKLPNYMCGFYGCCELGLVLVTLPDANNTRLPKPPFVPRSGDLIQVKIKTPDSLPKDQKSGGLIIKI